MAIKIQLILFLVICFLLKSNICYAGNIIYLLPSGDSIISDTLKKLKKYPDEKNIRIYGESYLLDDAAFTQGKKTLYYKNYNILLRKISYGINDNLDISFLTLPYFGLNNLSIGFGGKYKIKITKSIAIAIKSDYYNFNKIWRNSLMLSIGNYKNNASIALNKLEELGSMNSFEDRTVITFHGRLNLKNHIYIQFENFYYSRTNSLSIYSVAIQKQKFDVSLGIILFNDLDRNEIYNFLQGTIFSVKVPFNIKK